MNATTTPVADRRTWAFQVAGVAFTLAAEPAWLADQRRHLGQFLPPAATGRELAAFTIRAHTDTLSFRKMVDAIADAPDGDLVEPVPGLLLRRTRLRDGQRCYTVHSDQVEHRPGAYAVAVRDREIDLFLHSATDHPHRYPIRLVREAVLRTLEDDGGVLFHAAGIDVGGSAVMIAGPRAAGKTTTAAALLRLPRAALLSNDRLVHHHGHVLAVPLPVPAARGTIEAFPELRALATGHTSLPADFGATTKHPFTARAFAAAFGACLAARSRPRLLLAPRFTDTTTISTRPVDAERAREILTGICCTPRDEFWTTPWVVPRRRDTHHLTGQARAAVDRLARSVPCVEVHFGVRTPIQDLTRVLHHLAEGLR
ncbi:MULTISPECIES: hypothetical protein [Actinosynnema]|uniref:hypothetical protein n=1 Tax=Actinosynnema TaxID=40566 RepID=UPI0020A2F335|nr:hypothetical protein [Actinosynnema pretiosum]MCP2094721.1 hypothetical protein [Actinosynnema pretiosum]